MARVSFSRKEKSQETEYIGQVLVHSIPRLFLARYGRYVVQLSAHTSYCGFHQSIVPLLIATSTISFDK